ncbi:MAG: undecaprenyl-diphosphatase, partial [Clostridia bacterium]|nr:undecaprenyl-diphosphatase [Clostridia bacterium]
MLLLKAILLGIIQGLCEFLPVSSSGHLALANSLFALP